MLGSPLVAESQSRRRPARRDRIPHTASGNLPMPRLSQRPLRRRQSVRVRDRGVAQLHPTSLRAVSSRYARSLWVPKPATRSAALPVGTISAACSPTALGARPSVTAWSRARFDWPPASLGDVWSHRRRRRPRRSCLRTLIWPGRQRPTSGLVPAGPTAESC